MQCCSTTRLECSANAPLVCVCSTGYSGVMAATVVSNTHTHTHTHAHTHTHTHTDTHTHTHKYTYIHTYIYTHKLSHTYTRCCKTLTTSSPFGSSVTIFTATRATRCCRTQGVGVVTGAFGVGSRCCTATTNLVGRDSCEERRIKTKRDHEVLAVQNSLDSFNRSLLPLH